MLNYNLYELKEIKSLRDLQKNQEDVKKDLFDVYTKTTKANKKFNIDIIDTIIGATITGFIMPLLIWDDNRTFNVIKIILFVVLGGILFTSIYQHTVFDLFIYVSSLRIFTDPGDTFIRLLFTVIFNFIGCNMYNIMVNKSLVYNKNSIL